MFETADVAALRDYLQSKGLAVGAITSNGFKALDVNGLEITGSPSSFSMQDPDGHTIGFIQYATPLRPHVQQAPISTRLLHAGFVMRDRAAMEHFYKDILGFRPYWHGGMKDDQTDWISLQVPDGTDWMEFMVNVPENADQHLRGAMNHIAFGVLDIQKAREQLVKNGVQLSEEPRIGRDGKWQLNLYDPDDTRAEFMEFEPVRRPCCHPYEAPHPKP